jgi:digeranylgeranylglycerophospholipid reductase
MDSYETVIVGAGPIGCYVAKQLTTNGRQVMVFEEHHTIGEPLHCAGLVTQRVLDITNCPSERIVQNTIYGAIIHSPTGSMLTIGGDKIHALVIDRQRFDEYIAQQALNAGAMFNLQSKVTAAKQNNDRIILDINDDEQKKTVECKLLIGADGAHSRIRTFFGFPKPAEQLQGIGAELSEVALDPKFVHIFVGRTTAPGFFAWAIPTNTSGTTARIGLCIGKHHEFPLQHYFTTFLHQPLFQDASILKRFGGSIPLGPLKRTTASHLMLVGDAAAQVKPTSGGGLYPGLLCASHCSDIAEAAFQSKQFDEDFLQRYHATWTKEIGRELSLGMRFRSMFLRLTDKEFDKYIEKLNTRKTIETINEYGDIDYPSRLAFPLLRAAPSLLSMAPALLRRVKP